MQKLFTLKELCRYPLGTFAEVIYRNSIFYPDDEAFVYGSKRVTFAEFNKRVNRLVNGLKNMGFEKGDVVVVLSLNSIKYMEVWGAAMKGGYILAHLSPRILEGELLKVLLDSRVKALFCGSEFSDMAARFHKKIKEMRHYFVFNDRSEANSYDSLIYQNSSEEPEVELVSEDPLVIFYTSGTTGVPKGAVYSHRQKLDNSMVKALEIGAQACDRNLIVLPMFHSGCDSHIWPFFIMGGCNVIQEKPAFDPALMLKTIHEEKITDVQIVATQLIALLNYQDNEQYKLESLKRIWYAASPMPVEILRRGLKKFGPIFMQGYGLTESGPHSTLMCRDAHLQSMAPLRKMNVLASCGRACFGVQIRVVNDEGKDLPSGEIGEIIIHSNRIMSGYWRQPDETENVIKDGWLYTGDMGYFDKNAYIYIVDRKNDIIITGGENVYSKEVEDMLYKHPSVYEAAVIGVPDPYWVERVHAVVILNSGSEITEEEIIFFCRKHIAKYKAPKSIEFVEELPKNPQGKILKHELRKHFLKKHQNSRICYG